MKLNEIKFIIRNHVYTFLKKKGFDVKKYLFGKNSDGMGLWTEETLINFYILPQKPGRSIWDILPLKEKFSSITIIDTIHKFENVDKVEVMIWDHDGMKHVKRIYKGSYKGFCYGFVADYAELYVICKTYNKEENLVTFIVCDERHIKDINKWG